MTFDLRPVSLFLEAGRQISAFYSGISGYLAASSEINATAQKFEKQFLRPVSLFLEAERQISAFYLEFLVGAVEDIFHEFVNRDGHLNENWQTVK